MPTRMPFASSIEKADLRLFFLCAILGLTSWTGLARLIRGEVLKMREQDYILAARASGVSSVKILFSHLLPNLMHLILIAMVMDFSGLVLAEAVLSYVGVGVDPSTFSYGTMINAARLELPGTDCGGAWWLHLYSCCCWCCQPTCLPTQCAMRLIRARAS